MILFVDTTCFEDCLKNLELQTFHTVQDFVSKPMQSRGKASAAQWLELFHHRHSHHLGIA